MKINSLDDLRTEIINTIYPVGSIYISVSNVSPSTFLGGEWERWGNGRSPLGVDETGTFPAMVGKIDSAELTGGEAVHTLTEVEMPKHTHKYDRHDFWFGEEHVEGAVIGTTTADGKRVMNTTKSAGSNNPHNNMHPYITCYMWKRTA